MASGVAAARRRAGRTTTFYVACGIARPNTFTFSPPAEACYLGWVASAMGFDGFLRWASNSWGEHPERDARNPRWPAGDTFLMYPGGVRSVRFERLREGIQDYEKMRILREEWAVDASAGAKAARARLDGFLAGIDAGTLDRRSAADVVSEGKRVLATLGARRSGEAGAGH